MNCSKHNNDMINEYKYLAFISYKREDEKWAKWLQHKLEHYKLPTSVRKTDPSLPERVRPVFKDTTDLAGGVLEKAIKEALYFSKYLIVICSPRAAQSPWVCKEVQEFINSGREEFIIPFIVDGEPNSKDLNRECFPGSLRTLIGEKELLGININENGRDAASIKVVARMFNIQFDTLWQRHQREYKKRRRLVFSALIFVILIVTVVALWILKQNHTIQKQNVELGLKSESILKANLALVEANDSIKTAYAKLTVSEKKLEKSNYELQESNNRLAVERDNVLKANWQMMESRARAVSEKAKELINKGDVVKGASLLLDIMPDSQMNPDKPFVCEMEQVFRLAYDSLLYGNSPLWTMSGHEGVQTSALFSPNSQYILTTSNDKTARIWDVKSGNELSCYQMQHDEAIHHATYRSMNDEILTNGYQNKIRRWKLLGNKLYDDGVVAKGKQPLYSHDGKYVIVKDGKLSVIYNAETFDRVFKEDSLCAEIALGNKRNIRALLRKGKDIVIKTEDGAIMNKIDISNVQDYIYQIAFSPDDDVLMLHTKTQLFFWNTIDANFYSTIEDIDIEGAEFSPDNIHIVTRTSDYGQVKFWNYHNGKEIDSLRLCYNEHPFIRNATFSRNGKYLMTSTFDGVTRIYKNPLISKPKKIDKLYNTGTSISFNSNSTGIECPSKNGHYSWFTINKNDSARSLLLQVKNNGIHCTSQSLTGLVAVSYWGVKDYINIVDISNPALETTIRLNNDAYINSICISPRGTYVAIACNDSFVHIYNIKTGKFTHKLVGHSNGVITCKFSTDEKFLITSSHDHTCRVWNVKTSQEQFKFLFPSELFDASLSPTNDMLIVSSWNGLHIIDIDTGVQIYHYPIYNCQSVAINPQDDNLYLIIQEDENSYTLSRLEYPTLDKVISYIKSQIGVYNFSPRERELYYLE